MSASLLSPREQAGGFWVCPKCGVLNLPAATQCERTRCLEPRPPVVEPAAEREGADAT